MHILREKHLVGRLKQGERAAYEELIDGYGAPVQRLVARYLANPADVEDVVQEIFCDIFRGIGQFRGDAALSTWIFRIAVNRCMRQCRRRAQCGGDDVELNEDIVAGDWRVDPGQSAVRLELSDQVHDALDRLSPLHADVVILCELHGFTYQECAAVLEIPIGTVKSRLFNAFQKLRGMLAPYVGEEVVGGTATLAKGRVR